MILELEIQMRRCQSAWLLSSLRVPVAETVHLSFLMNVWGTVLEKHLMCNIVLDPYITVGLNT